MKKNTSKKVTVEFDESHLPILINAMETYSRLQSGQIKMALDTVYEDRCLSYEEAQHIEGTIRYYAFPANPRREYDGHGGFYDQYENIYDEGGTIAEESENWKRKKSFPHLDHPNSSFGVGCKEMKEGTIAFEIKKTLEQYLHYKRNDGLRNIMDVSGDGAMQYSDTPIPKILNWKPQKEFKIPQRYQESLDKAIKNKDFSKAWEIADKAFQKRPVPKGKSYKIEDVAGVYYVIVEEPCL